MSTLLMIAGIIIALASVGFQSGALFAGGIVTFALGEVVSLLSAQLIMLNKIHEAVFFNQPQITSS